jgi:redox-sensitive bicupin YhaK (pirin superfamily)
MQRPIRIITHSLMTGVGPLRVAQPLPVHALRNVDPFILLHHAGPQTFEAGGAVHRIDPHPHRGFEPVSFVYKGSVLHRDSLGNEGTINAGEVQWITSGSGIIHSEGPTAALQEAGGELEMIQLWVNLPAEKKMMTPAYQELHRDHMIRLDVLNGALDLDLVSGSYMGHVGPATTQSPVLTAMGHFRPGPTATLAAPAYANLAIYVLNGQLRINGDHVVERHSLAVFESTGDTIEIEALTEGSLLLLGGQPLGEPVAMYGPFVMNTEEQLHEALHDYSIGKFGVLEH